MKFVGILSLLLSVYSLPTFAQTTPNTGDIIYLSQEENQFYVLLNQFRSQLGLPTVQIHLYLQNAAKKHADWMASQNFLTHYGPLPNETPFERMEKEGYVKYTRAGENVACGNGDALKTFRQWAFSPGHLANMINPNFHHIGISRSGTGNENCPYFWANEFGSITDPKLDPDSITDLNKIAAAVINVSGPIPSDKQVALPEPIEQQNGITTEGKPSASTGQDSYSLIQCMVPYEIGKNILSFIPATDALMELTPNGSGSYKAKIGFIQNGASTNYYPLYISNVSVVKNPNYPLLMIFAGATTKTGGFMIQFNTNNSSAQFDPYPASSGSRGSVLCSYKM